MARKIFTSHAKTKKFPSHVFPNAKPPFLRPLHGDWCVFCLLIHCIIGSYFV
ncbi:DUF1661 domain-containing protein, partial [Porphyromonas gingivalis]|uniref:DUF1661 domain-containing protein n=1 Tax=Porphyromonas gingivalis TaxID=837 RepID=UPI00351C82D0